MTTTGNERSVCDICGIKKDDVHKMVFEGRRAGFRICVQCRNICRSTLFPDDNDFWGKILELILQSKRQKRKPRELACELAKKRKLMLETVLKTITDMEQKRTLENSLKHAMNALDILNCPQD